MMTENDRADHCVSSSLLSVRAIWSPATRIAHDRSLPVQCGAWLPGENGEAWCIAGSTGWLHTSWSEALTDAFGVAGDFAVPIVVEGIPRA
jgi:hypothetical protein